jgi:hypothetical protein
MLGRPWLALTLIGILIYAMLQRSSDSPTPPSPIDEPGFRVLVVEETERRAELSQGQHHALFSTEVRQWLDDHCIRDSEGHPARLFVDSDTDLNGFGKSWESMREFASPPYPCMVVSNPPSLVRIAIKRDMNPNRMIAALSRERTKTRKTTGVAP